MGIRILMACVSCSVGCWFLVDAVEPRGPFVINRSGHAVAVAVKEPNMAGGPPRPCDPYFNLEKPGREPRPFTPEVFLKEGSRLHGAVVMSPEGDRVCWSVVPPAIMCVECDDGAWSQPEALPLSGRAPQAPSFSSDGRRLFYQASGAGGFGSVDLWWVDVAGEEWSEAINLGEPVNGPSLQSQPTTTSSDELYFTGAMEGVEFGRGIYRAARSGSGYREPTALPASINTSGIDYCPFISRDGTTLLFASNRGHSGETMHIHVAFRTPSGGWTDPVDLHPLMQFRDAARFPSLSPDGRFLFFLSNGRFWWVDAAVLDSAVTS